MRFGCAARPRVNEWTSGLYLVRRDLIGVYALPVVKIELGRSPCTSSCLDAGAQKETAYRVTIPETAYRVTITAWLLPGPAAVFNNWTEEKKLKTD